MDRKSILVNIQALALIQSCSGSDTSHRWTPLVTPGNNAFKPKLPKTSPEITVDAERITIFTVQDSWYDYGRELLR